MFIGQYEHQLEEKGRLSVPKKFRGSLESGAILSQGLDGCLFLYPKSVWEALVQKLANLPLTKTDARAFLRSLSYAAVEVELDKIGRILVPDYLKKFAGIKETCILAGALDRIEIWDKVKFETYTQDVNSKSAEIAEKLELP